MIAAYWILGEDGVYIWFCRPIDLPGNILYYESIGFTFLKSVLYRPRERRPRILR